jgi:hypothetical protein
MLPVSNDIRIVALLYLKMSISRKSSMSMPQYYETTCPKELLETISLNCASQ